MEEGRQAAVKDVVSVESKNDDAAIELEAVEVLSAKETAVDEVVIPNILVGLTVEFEVKAELVVEFDAKGELAVEFDVSVELMSVLDVVIAEFVVEVSTPGGCVEEIDAVVGNSVIINDAVLEKFRSELDPVARDTVAEEKATELVDP